MDAKAELLKYAAKHNDGDVMSNEAWIGKALVDGIVINRTPASVTVARIARKGTAFTVTETIITEKNRIVDGRLEGYKEKDATVVMELSL